MAAPFSDENNATSSSSGWHTQVTAELPSSNFQRSTSMAAPSMPSGTGLLDINGSTGAVLNWPNDIAGSSLELGMVNSHKSYITMSQEDSKALGSVESYLSDLLPITPPASLTQLQAGISQGDKLHGVESLQQANLTLGRFEPQLTGGFNKSGEQNNGMFWEMYNREQFSNKDLESGLEHVEPAGFVEHITSERRVMWDKPDARRIAVSQLKQMNSLAAVMSSGVMSGVGGWTTTSLRTKKLEDLPASVLSSRISPSGRQSPATAAPADNLSLSILSEGIHPMQALKKLRTGDYSLASSSSSVVGLASQLMPASSTQSDMKPFSPYGAPLSPLPLAQRLEGSTMMERNASQSELHVSRSRSPRLESPAPSPTGTASPRTLDMPRQSPLLVGHGFLQHSQAVPSLLDQRIGGLSGFGTHPPELGSLPGTPSAARAGEASGRESGDWQPWNNKWGRDDWKAEAKPSWDGGGGEAKSNLLMVSKEIGDAHASGSWAPGEDRGAGTGGGAGLAGTTPLQLSVGPPTGTGAQRTPSPGGGTSGMRLLPVYRKALPDTSRGLSGGAGDARSSGGSLTGRSGDEGDKADSAGATAAGTATGATGSTDKKSYKRGACMEPQAIAARDRRGKIAQRLKLLQQLVCPSSKGGTDTVSMLEEAIGYVKKLQEQIKDLTQHEDEDQQCVEKRGKERSRDGNADEDKSGGPSPSGSTRRSSLTDTLLT